MVKNGKLVLHDILSRSVELPKRDIPQNHYTACEHLRLKPVISS